MDSIKWGQEAWSFCVVSIGRRIKASGYERSEWPVGWSAWWGGELEKLRRYSAMLTPEPPISLGRSFIFGNPSLMRSTVS